MPSGEMDLNSKDLNSILPSYLINEVQGISSENEENNSKTEEENGIIDIPFAIKEEEESNNEINFIEQPNNDKSFEYIDDCPKNESNDLFNYDFPMNKNDSLDDKINIGNNINNNINDISSNCNNNVLIYNNCSFLNFNNDKNLFSNVCLNNNNNNSNNLINLNQDNFKNLYNNNNYFNNNIQNFCNIGLNNNNNSIYDNQLFYLNQNIPQGNINNPFMNFNISGGYVEQQNNIKEYDINKEETNIKNNILYNNDTNNLNRIIFQENNINNYLNNNININNIQNNFIDNQNYISNIPNISNSFNNNEYQNIIINKKQMQNKNLDDFIKYLNSLPMPLVNFLCTPKGTSEIQKKLEKSNNEYRIVLVNLLRKQGLSKIMKNTYGNYFFQQLIKKNEKSFISLILSYIGEDLIDISKDYQGTFCLQALIDEISSFEEEQKILNIIKNYEMEMAFNKNATHVIQKIVLLFPDIHRIYLNEIILNNFIALSLDSNGICLIKKFMKTNTLMSNKKRIIEKIINNFVILSESPFGNYGVQYLMEIWDENDLNDVKEKILENIYELSLQQFSSNVIEKAIEIFSEENREKILKKLCFEDNFVIDLINNKFGKFVLNKAIKFMQTDMINEFEINLNNDINNNLYKNKDKNKIKKLLMKIKSNKKKEIYPKDVNKMQYNNQFYNNDEINNINNYNHLIDNEDVNI